MLQQHFKKVLTKKIIKHFGSLEAYTAYLIKISPNDERIEKLLAEKYDYYSKAAFDEEIEMLEFPDAVELFLKCKNKEVIAEYRDVMAVFGCIFLILIKTNKL